MPLVVYLEKKNIETSSLIFQFSPFHQKQPWPFSYILHVDAQAKPVTHGCCLILLSCSILHPIQQGCQLYVCVVWSLFIFFLRFTFYNWLKMLFFSFRSFLSVHCSSNLSWCPLEWRWRTLGCTRRWLVCNFDNTTSCSSETRKRFA